MRQNRSGSEIIGETDPRGTGGYGGRTAGSGRRSSGVIFRAIGEGRPYPDHGRVRTRDWTEVPPRVVRLAELITTKRTLQLDQLLSDDSTFHGDLFCHVVAWRGQLYLEDGVHRALRAALNGRDAIHARVLEIPS